MEVRRLADRSVEELGAWDRFVRACGSGTVFHLSTWKHVVEEVFHHVAHYFQAVEDGQIRGVLPLFEVRGLLSGHVLVSVPYGVYGGFCTADSAARQALLNQARELAERLGARHVELRHLNETEPGLPTKLLYSTFARALDADPEANFGAIPRKQRRMIRQGIKHGLEAQRGWEHLDAFHRIFVISRRHLGSPPFPRRLFDVIRNRFGKEAELLTIWHQGRVVAGVISFFYEDRVMPYYGAALPDAFTLAVNDFMYWELMRESCLAGYRVFDFGRSREGSGSYDFKRHWGFEPQPLAYQYLLVTGAAVPDISPSNPRLRLFIETWKRLPLPLTVWLGPTLTRRLPLD